MEDYVAPRGVSVRSCSASGTKFHDRNGDGVRARGEPGLPRWVIWADYDNDGVRDGNEPFTVTDSEGQYVLNDIRPPNGTYMLRETLLTRKARRRAAAAEVTCSYPNDSTPDGTGSASGGLFSCGWGPIDATTTPDIRNRDFGNYQAAQLTVVKQLEPASDPGRFNLFVNDDLVVGAAGDGASHTLMVRPGSYVASEAAVSGTDPLAYDSTAECKVGTRRQVGRAGTVFDSVQLLAGDSAVCTFRNVRLGAPAIAIDKTGPASAVAADTLRYTLFVTNPGDVPFPAASVQVTDPSCDSPPQLTSKADAAGADDSPGTLDPGDTWTYVCSHKTTASEPCTVGVVRNRATATGSAGGSTVTDTVTIETDLTCPPTPGPQPPEPPNLVVPPGPTPPDNGDSGRGGVIFTKACTRGHAPRVNFRGTRVARIQVYVNGRLRRRLTLGALQRRASPRLGLRPGSHRVTVRVYFERGTGTPPVRLRGRIRVCGVRHVTHVHFIG